MTNDQAPLPSNPSRRDISRQRRRLSVQQRRISGALASRHLTKLISRLPKNAKVGIYIDDFGELPTQPLLDWCLRMGYSAYLPVINTLGRGDRRIRFAPIAHSKLINIPTVRHRFGMKESKHKRLLWAKELDLVICPLVAADKEGNRMGMGGGFYDTTLGTSYRSGASKPLRVGWCYDFQVVDKLERQPWDVPLNGLITPSGLRWF